MKKIGWLVVVLFLGGLIWYLFLKPYDYLVSIKTNTFPGAVNQTIKLWALTQEDSKFLEQDDLSSIRQQLSFNDSTYVYEWQIVRVTDSTSKIKVYISDVDHSIQNRMRLPFIKTDFEKRTAKTLTDFTKKLNEHITSFKVTMVGEGDIPSAYCLYIPIESTQFQKANGMMQNYGVLTDFIIKNNIEPKGPPFIEITDWNVNKDSIRYNFCFPIIKNDSIPDDALISHKQFKGTKAIKAIYNGNYITSDRAWYALMNYAKSKNIEVTRNAVEIFYNNPNMGGDELNWKAEIFMPLKTK